MLSSVLHIDELLQWRIEKLPRALAALPAARCQKTDYFFSLRRTNFLLDISKQEGFQQMQ